VYAQYTLQVENRDRVRETLQQAGIPSAVYYPVTLDQQPALRDRCRIVDQLEVTHALAARVVSLPMHPYLDEATQDHIVDVLRGAL
jgi:UDP-2-acetamido-2-deoxy-ribo-hexuluronate aminotransferase